MKPFFSFALAFILLAGSLEASNPPAPAPRSGGDATLTGQVLTPEGAPASGAVVVYFGLAGRQRVLADAEGHYQIQGLRTEIGTLLARHEEHGVHTLSVDLRPGENHLDVTLEPMPPSRAIRGRVVDQDGRPVEGVQVQNNPEGFSALTDADGSFLLETRQSGFDLVAKKAGFASGLLHDFAGTASSEGLEIRLGEPIPLSGRIRGIRSSHRTEVKVNAYGPNELIYTAGVGPDGRYQFPWLEPGRWEVVARLGKRSTSSKIEIAPGEKERRLDLRFHQEP
ncbi:MAG TPA: carboxypeptidase-like regulatory domain-containing protein [Thermoanaerobaculia bacterium]|jgi:hypothetical protein|nr:carboxypeptidase-like regulatory domain-containing protein [Thermoanaerobaculia bacterium]